MPRAEFPSPGPSILESLEAIDATLAGDPVDPAHAELAELALLLRAERPELPPAFATALDARLEQRFDRADGRGGRPQRRARGWIFAPAAAVAASVIVAVVIVVSQGPSSPGSPQALPDRPARSAGPVLSAAAASRAAKLAPAATTPTPRPPTAMADQALSVASAGSPAPPPDGRRIVQSAQLALTTRPVRIDAVAQEVFDVAGRFSAIVQSSSVTAVAGPGGYAQFQLSIPSGSLAQAMSALSSLPYARVASRTDSSQDVNNEYQSDVRALADARARRTALLRQLAVATTQAQIQSLTAQLHDAEASISSDEATLRVLSHRIGYSQVDVTINGAVQPLPVRTGGHGLTLGTAAHDAGRVLTVAAGVGLIGLAAAVPLALVAALGWWIFWALRRRRRESALDLV